MNDAKKLLKNMIDKRFLNLGVWEKTITIDPGGLTVVSGTLIVGIPEKHYPDIPTDMSILTTYLVDIEGIVAACIESDTGHQYVPFVDEHYPLKELQREFKKVLKKK